MKKIATCLWFNGEAEAAVKFYKSIFKDTKVKRISRYGKDLPGAAGTVMTIEFKMHGTDFVALNGGADFKFNEAVSMVVYCKNQRELDGYWKKLTQGGKAVQCGWLTDKYGLSWQIVPEVFIKQAADKNPKKAQAAMQAMMKMVKLDIKELTKAFNSAGKKP